MTDEELARDTVDCRRCGAVAPGPCHDSSGNELPNYEGGPLVHPARLHDYLAQLNAGQATGNVTASATGTVTPAAEADHG